jgi:hypothetical protein
MSLKFLYQDQNVRQAVIDALMHVGACTELGDGIRTAASTTAFTLYHTTKCDTLSSGTLTDIDVHESLHTGLATLQMFSLGTFGLSSIYVDKGEFTDAECVAMTEDLRPMIWFPFVSSLPELITKLIVPIHNPHYRDWNKLRFISTALKDSNGKWNFDQLRLTKNINTPMDSREYAVFEITRTGEFVPLEMKPRDIRRAACVPNSAFVIVAEQEWLEDEDGWHECGWFVTVDDVEREVHESTWEQVEVLDTDKHGHPIKASFRKRVN